MTGIENANVATEALKSLRKLYDDDAAARAMLDHFANRERNRRCTPVRVIQRNVEREGNQVSRPDVVRVFRKLEELELGRFVSGRRGRHSRFEWRVALGSVGQYASQERDDLEPVAEVGEQGDDAEDELLQHRYQLRRDLAITLELPRDLTPSEAQRLARVIETLPFDR
jgi:hypothetical protein